MEFEWDEDKCLKVMVEWCVDMLYVVLMFEGLIVICIDDCRDYGEIWLIVLGFVDDECFVVVYMKCGDIIRLIIVWKGGCDE